MLGIGACSTCGGVVTSARAEPTATTRDDAGWLVILAVEVTYEPCGHTENRTFTMGESS